MRYAITSQRGDRHEHAQEHDEHALLRDGEFEHGEESFHGRA
jgi:hypothetical protein